jgi:hypothetical protein
MKEPKKNGKTYIVDIDDTILMYPDTYKPYHERGSQERYYQATPNKKEIKKLNKLWVFNTIILFTGRGWHWMELTKKQLKEFGIKYDSLIMGKPPGIYIDKDSLKEVP